MRRAWPLVLGLTAVSFGPARAAEPEAVPGIPACCAVDSTCCERQGERNQQRPPEPSASRRLDLAALAYATSAPANGDSHVGFYDDYGAPHAVPLPQGTTRFVPEGRAGMIRIGDPDNFFVVDQFGFFRDPPGAKPAPGASLRQRAFGVVLDRLWAYPIVEPLFWEALDVDAGKLVYRRFVGHFDRYSGKATDGTVMRAELADIADGWAYAFRSRDDEGEKLHVVCPSGFVENSDAAVDPSNEAGVVHVTMPLDEDSSGFASIGVFRSDVDSFRALERAPADGKVEGALEISTTRGKGETQAVVMIARRRR